MRGEISPMIAQPSTSTRPKWAAEMAKSAEFLAKPLLITQKELRADTFFQESAGEPRIPGR
jgi:hypothetical protein